MRATRTHGKVRRAHKTGRVLARHAMLRDPRHMATPSLLSCVWWLGCVRQGGVQRSDPRGSRPNFPEKARKQASSVSRHTVSTLALREREVTRRHGGAPCCLSCWADRGPHVCSGHLMWALSPYAFTPQTMRGTGVPSRPSARRWPPRVWRTPLYQGGGHPPHRHSSKNNNAGLS